MAALLHFAAGPAAWWLRSSWQLKVPALAALVLGGALVYGAALFLLGFRLRDFFRQEPA